MQKKRCFHSQNPPKFALMNILCFQLRKANILRAKDVASVVKEEYLRAQLEVEVDDAELALFLSIEVSREELERLGLG